MKGETTIDTGEDRKIFSVIFGSLIHPQKVFGRDPSLSIVSQTLLHLCFVSGILYPIGRIFATGSATGSMTVVFALSIIQFCLIIPSLIILESLALFIPLKVLKGVRFTEVFKPVVISMSPAPITVLLVALPRPIPAAALIPMSYILYLQVIGIRHYTKQENN